MRLTTKLLAGAATALALTAMAANAETIRFWTTEEQPERLARQEALAAQFAEATGHEVEVIPVTESDLGTRATAAFAAGDLPDVIYHSLQFALPWAEAGILDTDAATDVIENLGMRHVRTGRFVHGRL
jgi:multiple sugar transport system substrate-binding protein